MFVKVTLDSWRDEKGLRGAKNSKAELSEKEKLSTVTLVKVEVPLVELNMGDCSSSEAWLANPNK
jgi:hypothetical protein